MTSKMMIEVMRRLHKTDPVFMFSSWRRGGRREFSEYYSPIPTINPLEQIHDIIIHNNVKALSEMLETKDIDPNLRFENLRHCTPLMLAAEYGTVEMVKSLLRYGAKLNLQDDFGEDSKGDTAIIMAAREKRKEVVKSLIEAGAQLDILNYEQMTAADCTLDPELDHSIRQKTGEDVKSICDNSIVGSDPKEY
eukprot:scaffold3378_cov175-Ochromonas_danica.AAC.5